ncbi:hypothetical protein ACTFIU_006819 [Dictyostelium citrinum]
MIMTIIRTIFGLGINLNNLSTAKTSIIYCSSYLRSTTTTTPSTHSNYNKTDSSFRNNSNNSNNCNNDNKNDSNNNSNIIIIRPIPKTTKLFDLSIIVNSNY